MRAAALVFAGLLVVLVVGFVLLRTGHLRFNYPSRQRYPVWGLDVSHHQGRIDWDAVGREDYAFAFIKATEGGDYRDSLFQRNWEGAARAGLARGAYHFFRFCTPGAAQARNFIEAVPAGRHLPPVADVEFGGNCRYVPPADTVRARLAQFLAEVERAFGQTPLLYTDRRTYDAFLTSGFAHYPLWINDKLREPGPIEGRRWVFWQFTAWGRVEGIPTPVDLNVFSGSSDAFARWIAGR